MELKQRIWLQQEQIINVLIVPYGIETVVRYICEEGAVQC